MRHWYWWCTWWACCCCRHLQLEVRGLLLLTTIETVAGFAYGSNLLATAVTSDEDVDPAVYYIATFIVCMPTCPTQPPIT